MLIKDDRPEDDDKEAVDKYINMELIFDVGTDGERSGVVMKRAWGMVPRETARAMRRSPTHHSSASGLHEEE